VLAYFGKRVTISAFSFGVGVFLPMQVSIPIFLGGLCRLVVQRSKKSAERGDLVAASMLGGEGIMGFAIAVYAILPFLIP
jgi:uncharacterized oligopeptide transporter (OPT) family protein